MSDLVAASVDTAQVVIVGPGAPGEFNAPGPVSFASFGRDVVVPALAVTDGPDPARGVNSATGGPAELLKDELPTPLMVARYLASRDIAAHPEHAGLWASARWITTDGTDATDVGERLRESATPIALILIADGATCHGPKAPRAEDSRAPAYQESVCSALAAGRPGQLAQIDPDLGRELGATGPQLWPVLVAASDDDWTGELVWSGWPYGVGWSVAAWRRAGINPGAVPA